MLTNKSKILFEYLKENYKNVELDGSSGKALVKPKYDLYSRDYMKFAQNNMKDDTESKINCVSFLKRAIDCQTDYFLSCIGLSKIISKNRFGVDKKLKFLSDVGIFDQQSLSKLNNIRNKMEHDYSIPNIDEIDV